MFNSICKIDTQSSIQTQSKFTQSWFFESFCVCADKCNYKPEFFNLFDCKRTWCASHSDHAHSITCQHQKRRLANAHEDPRRTVWHAMIVEDGKKIVQALWRNEKLIKDRLKSTQWSRSSNVCVYVRRSLWQLITPSFILADRCH